MFEGLFQTVTHTISKGIDVGKDKEPSGAFSDGGIFRFLGSYNANHEPGSRSIQSNRVRHQPASILPSS